MSTGAIVVIAGVSRGSIFEGTSTADFSRCFATVDWELASTGLRRLFLSAVSKLSNSGMISLSDSSFAPASTSPNHLTVAKTFFRYCEGIYTCYDVRAKVHRTM